MHSFVFLKAADLFQLLLFLFLATIYLLALIQSTQPATLLPDPTEFIFSLWACFKLAACVQPERLACPPGLIKWLRAKPISRPSNEQSHTNSFQAQKDEEQTPGSSLL